jgi:hypothetical protein
MITLFYVFIILLLANACKIIARARGDHFWSCGVCEVSRKRNAWIFIVTQGPNLL